MGLLAGLKEGNQHNDVNLVLDDGELEASKFVLSLRSEYFSKMFDKHSGFKENQARDVKISCKKVVMEKIVIHLYGGAVTVDGLNFNEVVELLHMLNLMVLEDAFKLAEKNFVNELESDRYPLEECIDAMNFVFSTQLNDTFLGLLGYIWRNIDVVMREHQDYIVKFSPDILKAYFKDRDMFFDDSDFFVSTLEFLTKWEEIHNPTGGFKATFKEEISMVDLKMFKIEELLGCVRKSKLFNDEDIDAAVLEVHRRDMMTRNRYDDDYSDYSSLV